MELCVLDIFSVAVWQERKLANLFAADSLLFTVTFDQSPSETVKLLFEFMFVNYLMNYFAP